MSAAASPHPRVKLAVLSSLLDAIGFADAARECLRVAYTGTDERAEEEAEAALAMATHAHASTAAMCREPDVSERAKWDARRWQARCTRAIDAAHGAIEEAREAMRREEMAARDEGQATEATDTTAG